MTRLSWIVVIAIFVIAIISYFFIKNMKSDQDAAVTPITPTPTPKQNVFTNIFVKPKPKAPSVFPLRLGYSGPEVLVVKNYMNKNYSSGLALNNTFDSSTEFEVNRVFGTTSVSESLYKTMQSGFVNPFI